MAPWRESLLQRGFCSGIALPLKDENDNAFGSLTIHSAQPNAFPSEEIRLLEELAGDLAFGIVNLRSRAARKQAEQALRQSEAYLAETQRLTHTCTFVTDDTAKPLYWSEELFRIFGFDPDHGLPTLDQLLQRIHPEDRDKFWKAFQKAIHEKVDSDVEFRIVLPDGTVKHAYRLDHPVLNANGELVEVLGTTVDITERKRAEEEVRNTAAQWQATFDAVRDLVLLLDKDFRVLRVNHAAAEFLGLPFDKIVGGHCYDLIHGTFAPPAECPLAKMRQSRKHEEAEVLAKKGGPWLSVSVDPLFDPSGELTQVVHVARDITERKRAEEALRRSEAYLAESQRLTQTGSFAYIPGGAVLYWSEEALRIWGFDQQQAILSHEMVRQRIHPDDRGRARERAEKALGTKTDWYDEFRIVLPDGTVKHIHAIHHPVFSASGELVELVGTHVDVTERKRAERVIQARFRLLEFAGLHSMDELITATLDELEALTASSIGFYHFLESDQLTLSLQSWSTNTLKSMCTAEGKGGHYDVAEAGVWVDCVHQRRPVIHNDYASLPHRKGMPEGHAKVYREVVCPIFRGDKIVAIVGLGNKPTDYDESDIEIVSQVGDLSWDIVDCKRAEEALLEERVRERTRIARELHDTLLQSFHGLLLKFQVASDLFSMRPDDAKQILDGAIDEAAQAITEGRDAIQGLRSSPVETNDLDAAIRTLGEELAADQSNPSSAVFQVAVVGTPQELSPRLRDEVYSIAAEGLRNAFRHAEARQIEVEIRYDEPQFRLRVRDDGRGIDPKVLAEGERAGHWGLHGMRERAKLVGGNLSVRSELGSGTEIELSTPASAAYAASPGRSAA
jgi:PAS domain S-box-containing protein